MHLVNKFILTLLSSVEKKTNDASLFIFVYSFSSIVFKLWKSFELCKKNILKLLSSKFVVYKKCLIT